MTLKTTTVAAPILAVLLLATPVSAQQPGAAPAPATPADPAAPPPTDAPLPPATDAATGAPPPPPLALDAPPPPAEPAAAPLPDRVADLEGKVEGLNETMAATQGTLTPLTKLKFSGYIQGRYEWRDDSNSGVDSMGRVTNFDRFLVRRARLKATYTGENAEYMLQIDGIGPSPIGSATQNDGVGLRDAEATFVDTWTPFNFRVTMGQFKMPFGYEVLQSSGDREMPERSRVIRALFPNERDRGLRLTGRWEFLRLMAALTNGNFTNDAVYGTFDQNRFRDVFGRLIGDFEFLVVGLSGQYGQKINTTLATAARTTGTDMNGDGMITGDEITFTPATTPSMQRYSVWRLGADVQTYFDIPYVGGLALKGEVVLGKENNLDFRGAAANTCRDLKQFGYILTLVQNIGDHVGVVARFDQYNPNRDVTGTGMSCVAPTAAAATDMISTLGVGPIVYISGNLKASAVYEHVWRADTLSATNATRAPNQWVPSDLFTLQLQAKF